MKIFKALLFTLSFFLGSIAGRAQDASFIVLGDMHFDRLEYHDLDYVMTRPQDYEQIFKEYPQYTAFFMPKFLLLFCRPLTL